MKQRLCAGAALAAALALHPVPVFATAKIYDMSPLIYEPHPFQPVVPLRYRSPDDGAPVSAGMPSAAAPQQAAAPMATPAPAMAPAPPRASTGTPAAPPVRRASPAPARRGLALKRDDAPGDGTASPPSYLFGQPGHYYLSGALGLAFLGEASNKGTVLDIDSDYQAGFTLGAAGGFRFRNGARGEVEIAYRRFGLDTLTVRRAGGITGLNIGTSDVSGSASALAFMANVAYGMDVRNQIVPHAMAGLGPALVSANDVESLGTKVADDSAWVMAFQIGVGATVPIDARWSVGGEYRWFWTTDPELTDAAGDPFDSEFSSHNFTLFARYTY